MLQHLRRLVLPFVALAVTIGFVLHQSKFPEPLADDETLTFVATAAAYFAVAWTASRIIAVLLDKIGGRRPHPRLLKDLISAFLFMMAFIATTALYLGQGAVGALAGSGIILALLGFAIRNVVADTLSGVALAIEAPFRIGDWIDIESLARGKVIEIGWRTTRLQTLDATYVILPNSQISRQRITNYSAPKREFRAQIQITLDHVLPIEKAREIILQALSEAKMIQQEPAADVRVRSYEESGICYTVRYWVPRFERAIDCRDEIFSLIDDGLRRAGSIAPYRRIQLVSPIGDGSVPEEIATNSAEER
ncbi:putative mechanosensitive channel protein [Litoreibacter arenae DSM 19593]|uniref:Small-conductance mechanosensitive channel n=2 Tax=Litoreibacter TaxID=947567 RepID=S9RW70_9RHOB|nr:putative mechanosensitive channel protein [Litoreibacter arenae DSM 19593]